MPSSTRTSVTPRRTSCPSRPGSAPSCRSSRSKEKGRRGGGTREPPPLSCSGRCLPESDERIRFQWARRHLRPKLRLENRPQRLACGAGLAQGGGDRTRLQQKSRIAFERQIERTHRNVDESGSGKQSRKRRWVAEGKRAGT